MTIIGLLTDAAMFLTQYALHQNTVRNIFFERTLNFVGFHSSNAEIYHEFRSYLRSFNTTSSISGLFIRSQKLISFLFSLIKCQF